MANPGPGRYNVDESRTRIKSRSPSCTFGTSPRKTIMTITFSTPGPGEYDPVTTKFKHRGPTYQIGLKFSPRRDITPGPGTYDKREDSLSSSSSANCNSFRFPQARRQTMQEVSILEKIPGPGAYNADTINSSFSTMKGISMA